MLKHRHAMNEELVGKVARRAERRAAQAPVRLVLGGAVAVPLTYAAARSESLGPLILVLLAILAWALFSLLPLLAAEESARLTWNRATGTLVAQTGSRRPRLRAEVLVTNVARVTLAQSAPGDAPWSGLGRPRYILLVERKTGDPVVLATGSDASELRAAGNRIAALAGIPFERS